MERNNRILLGLTIAFLLLVIVLSGVALSNSGQREPKMKVSVILDNSADSRWVLFKSGMERAAEDYGIRLSYVSAGRLTDLTEEMRFAEEEVADGAKGLIMQLVPGDGAEAMCEDLGSRSALILVDTEAEELVNSPDSVSPRKRWSYVGVDHYATGRTLGEMILKDLEERKAAGAPVRIGVEASRMEMASTRRRLEGLRDALGNGAAEIAWLHREGESEESLVDAVAALDDESLAEAMAAKLRRMQEGQEAAEAESLYGIGVSDRNVYYLDKGMISGMMVVNEFNMGYQAVAACSDYLRHRTYQAEIPEIGSTWVTRDTMFREENQQLLFPVAQ